MKHVAIPILMLALFAVCAVSACTAVLPKQLGETDAEFKQRKHDEVVVNVNRAYLLVDTGMNIAKSQGAGDEEFWAKYAKARLVFNAAFVALKASGESDGDTIDKMMAALNALSAELAAMDDAPVTDAKG